MGRIQTNKLNDREAWISVTARYFIGILTFYSNLLLEPLLIPMTYLKFLFFGLLIIDLNLLFFHLSIIKVVYLLLGFFVIIIVYEQIRLDTSYSTKGDKESSFVSRLMLLITTLFYLIYMFIASSIVFLFLIIFNLFLYLPGKILHKSLSTIVNILEGDDALKTLLITLGITLYIIGNLLQIIATF